MSHSTTQPVPPTRVAGTVEFDAGELALRIADMVVPRVLAGLGAADDRNGPYDPNMDRYTVTIGDHGPGEHRTRIRRVGEGYEVRCSCGGLDAGASDAGLAEQLAAEHRRQA